MTPSTTPRTHRRALVVGTAAVVLATTAAVLAVPRRGAPAASYPGTTTAARAGALLGRRTDDADRAFQALDACLAGAAAPRCARQGFLQARLAYKALEPLAEYYAAGSAAVIDGRRPDIDDDDAPAPPLTANGFAALEPLLLPTVRRADSARVIVRTMREALRPLGALRAGLGASDAQLFDAARLEIARVFTVGLAGVDAPVTRSAVPEAAAALRAVAELTAAARPPADTRGRDALEALRRTLADGAAYLDAHPDFERLDRLTVLTTYTEPALRRLEDARVALRVPRVRAVRSWTGPTLFAASAMDPGAHAPAFAPVPTDTLVGLGRTLFFDPALSGDGSRACASCHQPTRAFTDGRAHSTPHAGARLDPRLPLRNAPSLITAAYEPALFADERAAALEDQVDVVMRNPAEMAGSPEAAARRLAASDVYVAAFHQAFRDSPSAARDTAISARRVRAALAAYVRSLARLDPPFDRAARGDTAALGASARRGFTVFMGKGGCGTCHYAPLFSGAAPPFFSSSDVEVLGVPTRPGGRAVDADLGLGRLDRKPEHAHAFKIPSLRNVALTAPYMHNGVFRTLEEVVEFYDRGGGTALGERLPNQTLPARPLHLSAGEKRDLVAFLRALTDTAGTTAAPARLPHIESAPGLDGRRIGGAY